MKRGKIALGTPLVFRFSMPGADVDIGPQSKMLMHESVFLSQIIQSGTVSNPGSPTFTATVAFDPSLINPLPIVYPVYSGNVAFPGPMAYVSNLHVSIKTGVSWSCSAGVLSILFPAIVTAARYAIIRQEAP
ncbi:hypothetical protein [Mesorhizobium sp.]|uniref:hypothetical protein n=1 Tax=Mesorhizobium sp. TaxID=1871066 RepID=UPI000FEA60FC|nr:hypothetical protein [Mesorhizobium sp.]RWC58930.1 MAG: hypothetical protein EOS56_18650 [Mesorhizobium sp.]RWC66542.1 MAG: hypothetical protein EOS29_04005 [Mesorhizobium sp.]